MDQPYRVRQGVAVRHLIIVRGSASSNCTAGPPVANRPSRQQGGSSVGLPLPEEANKSQPASCWVESPGRAGAER